MLSLLVDRPAVGGPMIARADGQVVLVTGAIPGERVRARIDRVGRSVAFATAIEVQESSRDRRAGFPDPACGGCVYSHIAYPRQLEIKGQVVVDAFARIGRLELPAPVPVAASREDGYRMRARLHVRAGRLGFFREGTHDVCDPRQSQQLLPETCDALERLMASARSLGDVVREVELSENIAATERVVQIETSRPIDRRALETLAGGEGLTAGPYVIDDFGNGDAPLVVRRHVRAFFQGNRYLIRRLADHVVSQVPADGRVLDLYAGAGVFSVTAARRSGATVTAVEGDRHGAADLAYNAEREGFSRADSGSRGSRGSRGEVRTIGSDVESFLARRAGDAAFDAAIVDPPRTGLSPAALDGLVALAVGRIVYVSCDVATLARDARKIVDAGYGVANVQAFDMFPNTPHVETVVVFNKR
ncbi:MAG TPA: RsmD family RNA methyltransferase [Vicinamibacterales bacterium]